MDLISKNPETGDVLVQHQSYDSNKVALLVAEARRAQSSWGNLTFEDRGQYLIRAQRYMVQNSDQIAKSITLNNGKPLVQAMAEVLPMVETVSYLTKNAKKILKKKSVGLGLTFPTKGAYIVYRPIGVVGIISPWNYPFSTPMAEVFSALIAGNSVVLKGSEVTGLVNDEIERVVAAMGLPAGVFTMISGSAQVGEALVRSGVDRLILTGSVNTGKKVMAAASENLTPLTLELGGKDSMIVLDDADLEVATSAAVTGSLYNTGQTCCSVEKLLVHESLAPSFVELLARKIHSLRQKGSAFERELGPITFEGQKKIYLKQSQDFQTSGGKTIVGDLSYDGHNAYINPIVVLNPEEERLFWKEETFGPVLAIKTFRTDAEAIELNNKTSFGLTAVIWSKNKKRARKMAQALNVGTVVVNDAPFTNAVPSVPWGGVKESGLGWVHGELGLKEMVRPQVVTFDRIGQLKQFWWFPHSRHQYDFFRNYVILRHGSGIVDRLKALLKVLSSFFKMGPRL